VKERLQKLLARAGYGSRRSVETIIAEGRVRINGRVAGLGLQVDPERERIEVDGERVVFSSEQVHLALHKPAGFITTANDPQGRRTVMELLPDGLPPHVVPVGRLDLDTEGLLIFTNDGEFAHRLAHPRYEIDKEYLALVEGSPSETALAALRDGVEIEDKRTAPAQVERAMPPYGYEARAGHTWLRLIIHEGRKRQVRLMCAAVGHPVRVLVRTRVGDVMLSRLAKGTTRALSDDEVSSLRRQVSLDE
jgi:pseudouridine synthase